MVGTVDPIKLSIMMQVGMITLFEPTNCYPELFNDFKTQLLKVSEGAEQFKGNLVHQQVITVFRLMNQLHQPLTTSIDKEVPWRWNLRWIVQAALLSTTSGYLTPNRETAA